MSKHTPGPWKIKENASMVCVYAKTFNVACTGSSRVEKDNARNNAKLIAAAPDLLKALTSAIDYIDQPSNGETEYGKRARLKILDDARAAIFNATT